mmetsp:Transcript_10137/g.29509  ORF Transcript_10137/g.29509 Transcript_10137/m.29509 type:complete len:208 (+) Transcript_10137:143-766(+)
MTASAAAHNSKVACTRHPPVEDHRPWTMPESQPVGSPDIVRSLPSWPTDALRLLVARLIRGRPDALRPLYTSSLLLSWKSCIDAQTPQDWGQFGSIKSFFASHALVGSCAQLGQSEYLSSQASVHTPHISGHSFITDDGFEPHSCSPQMWHCLRSESPQAARGAMLRPSAVLASMSTGCLAALWVISLQTMHECGHSLSMKAGLSMH